MFLQEWKKKEKCGRILNNKNESYVGTCKMVEVLSSVQILIAERWERLLEGTDLKPIDVHTPMWLWSIGKFAINIF